MDEIKDYDISNRLGQKLMLGGFAIMLGGITGKILRVDLTKRTITEEVFTQENFVKYGGADGIASRILYNEVPPGIAALDPESRIVFSAGPLAGTGIQASCTHSIAAKSPLSGFTPYLAHSQGHLAIQLKFSGYDGVIVQGKADKPVYIWINDGTAEIKDAAHLWGKDTTETQALLIAELGHSNIGCACIGPAGENLVLIAGIVTDKDHTAARGGLGAVMGSKNLKALAAYGQTKVPIANLDKFKELAANWRQDNVSSNPGKANHQYGSANFVETAYKAGDLPIKNWSRGTLDGYIALTGQSLVGNYLKKHTTCPSCTLAHRKLLELKGGAYSGECSLPEFECIGSMGSNIGVTEPTAVCWGNDLLNKFGLDALATSTLIAWAMECTERGILTKEDTDGIDLRFGDYKAAFEMIRKIAVREGFGSVLADGPIPAVEHVGRDSDKLMVQVKGMSLPMHDHRAFWGYGLQYAVGSAGPAHEGGPLGAELSGVVQRFSIAKKAQLVKDGQILKCFLNTLGVCNYGAAGVSPALILDTVTAATGLNYTTEDRSKIALRGLNLRRAFSIRHGLEPADDTLPYRYTDDSPPDGGAKGSKIPIKPMVRDYYNIMGWDVKTGKPYRKTLVDLGLEKEADDLWGKA